MPSFDITSEVDRQEIDNAINQARKEIAARFDFKGADPQIDWNDTKIELRANDAPRLRALLETLLGRMSRRNIDLRNIVRKDPQVAPTGHARQELEIKQGLDGDKAKEIIRHIKDLDMKVQSQLQDRQIRVSGKKRDDLQAVIAAVRAKDFGVGLGFGNFRD